MCGIFGYVGARGDAAQVVLHGLRTLEYRGYDSWGVAVARAGSIAVDKRVGRVCEGVADLPASGCALGHTRWATHGRVTAANAHPMLDCRGRLAVVHNGIVDNEAELRDELRGNRHSLCSQTDSELIAHLLEEALVANTADGEERLRPEVLLEATLAVFRRIEGLNAIAVLDGRTGAIAAAKSGTPLAIGHARDASLLASDHLALLPHTRQISFVGEGEAALLTAGSARLYDVASGRERSVRVTRLPAAAASAELAQHPDFMTKEMLEQPALLRRLPREARPEIEALAAAIAQADSVLLTGCGSAGHAGLAAEYWLARAGVQARFVPASELAHAGPSVRPGTLLVALSQSGETIDVLDAVRFARARGARIAAVTNVEGASLQRAADLAVALRAGPERCVLATKSVSAKLAVLLLTAAALRDRYAEAAAAVVAAGDEIASMLQGERRAAITALAGELAPQSHLYALGRGLGRALALETALKIKEVSYLHAEGLASGELKHGAIALIEPDTPCVVLASDPETLPDLLAAAAQVKARGARVIGIGASAHPAFDHHIEAGDFGDASAVVHAIPGQVLGYELARLRGHDPDYPRHLAKSVTVK